MKCKRCGLKTVLDETDIQQMVDEVKNMPGIRLCNEETYNARFNTCLSCNDFMYNSTCGICGCVMQVRARLFDGKCPRKKW